MSSTAKSHLSLGRGDLVAATASRAAASAADATAVASFVRPALFSNKDKSRNVFAPSQHVSCVSSSAPPARHPQLHPGQAHRFTNDPGNACCRRWSFALPASLRALAEFRAEEPQSACSLICEVVSSLWSRSHAARSSLNTPSATTASLCAKSAPPASAYVREVPRHACRSASNESMFAFRSANADAARPVSAGPPRCTRAAAAAGPELLASLGAISSRSASPAGNARTRSTSAAAAASTALALSWPCASRNPPCKPRPPAASRPPAPLALAARMASSTSLSLERTVVALVVAPRTKRKSFCASALAVRT
mmetsp:Transcript_1558/g.5887  ORF Transcript_1558/g.5887 Transcript_1558/m.5887 type:complete len:310 (+) Transcript_1558:3578-4507(+)